MTEPRQQTAHGGFSLALTRVGNWLIDLPVWRHPIMRTLIMLLAAAFFAIAIAVPLELTEQLVFASLTFGVSMLLRRTAGRLATIIMILLSITASLRYMFWRVTSTLGFENWVDTLFGYGLLMAEIYALIVLLLGYMQTVWPLRRHPVPMPDKIEQWPTVDIFIPTYNEPLNVVKQTVFTAMAMDWPREKLNVYVLDDGRRPEFRAFCEQVGAGYITRDNNRHAKAGNLNEALKVTDGEFVAIFDCDHIPTRSFLQICVGWFLRDPKLAMLQTPHVFFSPDPFEKNLNTFRAVPNEGELFYGLVQDGNDLWNATFFCGSCAVLRRDPLVEVGGIAVETVTEDAHTALKMNRRGYNTAYLALPQAAGLATESLSGHIGQRIRWARGMAQICRVDNPLFGPGLKLSQRLCYLNAMLHFFYGLPRLVFLTAPLAYLLFGAHVFQATALMITAYALPHILHASITNSRMQGRFRHSFWNEVYESVLAWYIMRPVMLAFINPKLGKFNVTAKGGVIDSAYFDWRLARPYIVLLCLNLFGFAVGLWHLAFGDLSGAEGIAMTIVINLAWTVYNILITSASVAVASETRQVRADPRVASQLQASITLESGRTLVCRTTDFSQNGVGLALPPGVQVPLGEAVEVSIFRDRDETVLPATVAFAAGNRLGLHFQELTIEQQMELAQMTFARADTWANSWGQGVRDTPLRALRDVSRIGVRGFAFLFQQTLAQLRARVRRGAGALTPNRSK
ncbi:UDP-forming cellulose synthase catalytic subunit [Achromobacter sp. GG226]|uniref:UDP-forming cellulose synthase catalytic subunit n=1 Tax=Verticiella alkaliphila TaxID=2779529 RepID=UPI001C0D4F15|nr:UDP-forming cellulose synthase catalytic subunit [Verticiella sp. GG226]MBU4609747.1 UDP-forming cellulose synthase catalytic subunit [Verticiella sp. GG226]